MPSLSALNEFKTSFSDIANEKNDVIARNLPFDSIALPTTEAVPFESFNQAAPASFDEFTGADSGETGSGAGDFDFGAFLSSLPGDVTPPPIDGPLQDTGPDASADGLPDMPSDESLDGLLQDTGPDASADGLPDVPSDESLDGLLQDTGPDASADGLPDMPSDESLDDLLQDTGLPDLDMSPEAPEEAVEDDTSFVDENPSVDEDEFSVPDGLLSGLSDEIESAPSDFKDEDFETGDFNTEGLGGEEPDIDQGIDSLDFSSKSVDDSQDLGEDFPDFAPGESSLDDEHIDDSLDLGGEKQDGTLSTGGNLEDFSLSEDTFAADDAPVSEDNPFSDFDLPEPESSPLQTDESVDDDLDMGEGVIDLGGELPAPGGEASGENFVLDDVLPDIDFSAAAETAQDGSEFESSPLPGFDFPETEGTQDDTEFDGGGSLPDMDFSNLTSGSLPDLGDIGGEFASDSIELESESNAQINDVLGPSDFALPGLEEIFDKSKIDAMTQRPAPKKGFFRKRKQEIEEEPDSDEVEEIRLTEEDLEQLLATLASYPLNLRVACEELIAECVLEPQQLTRLIKNLIRGTPAKETAEFAGQLLGKTIVIPKSFEKSSGAAWEAEKASFAYIFVHNFLPVLRLFAFIAALAASIAYLGYKFIYTPYKAETLYKRGYERIFAGEYQRANELFHEAFVTHRKKKWFYQYAEGFTDQRRYMLAENKYEELLRYYPRDKKGVLDYANLETYYLLNYDKANRILQQQLLDYAPNDLEGLLSAGDNFLVWADSDPSRFYDKYEDARFAYARLLEKYGWQTPVVERMMKFFIRTDNLKEVLYLRVWFDGDKNRRLSPPSLAELGGYLLDKQLAASSGEVKGVSDPYVESIESVRAMLLQAVREAPTLPEPHYHLARYYKNHGNAYEERLTLENAIRAFDLAESETVRRRLYRVDTHYRYANLLIGNKEFFPAEEQVVRGIELYEDFLSRNLISSSQQLGRLYATRGDLEYFVKSGNMQAALNSYHRAEQNGWAPPEIQYRMGAAYYQLEDWRNALEYLFKASSGLPLNRRLLYALGNTAYKRGDYFAAQGYYDRLLDILESQRTRLPILLPNDRPEFLELGERLMMARNNAGVVYEALAAQTGRRDYRSRALALYAESARAWDSITRNPQNMERMRLTDSPGAPGINLGFINASNAMRPAANYNSEIFIRIDKDALEPSRWEELAPFGGLQY